MKKIVSATMLVIGTVIGSGFASGKEIAVFFSRFGSASYVLIPLAGILFFFIIYAFFNFGASALKKLEGNRLFLLLTIAISLVFTSSMFAGTFKVLPGQGWMKVLFMLAIILYCFKVCRKEVGLLEKLNLTIIPLTLIAMIVVLSSSISLPKNVGLQNPVAGLFFAVLYVVLNFSVGGVVIAKSGLNMTKKQKVWASILSSATLSILLFVTNFVILSNPESMDHSMPIIFLSKGICSILISFVVFSGCITTLFSLVFTTAQSLKRLGAPLWAARAVAVIIPAAGSAFGFGHIVAMLYPLASVLGIFLLCLIFILPLRQ